MSAKLKVISHAGCCDHDPVPGHPERPARLQAALDGIAQLEGHQMIDAHPAAREDLAGVHSAAYLDHLESVERRIAEQPRPVALDADTHAGPGSLPAARLAAGAACQAAREAIASPGPPAFAVVRPPGHHAEAGRAMGFCLFNSIAAAAEAALACPGISKVAICDFDVHHGNGTEAVFAGRDDVLFVSSHQFPLYPGTGDPHQTVAANVCNSALPPGSGSNEFRAAWLRDLFDPVDRFGPDLILISAGFDAHWRDPLAQLDLNDEDFYWIGHQLRQIADSRARGRLAASLEGGYDLKALTESVLAFAEGLTS